MTTTETPILTPESMPSRMESVFRSLRKGRHICRDDAGDYRDLERHEDQYRLIFEALGYELVHHGQGFYYFRGDNTLTTQRLQGMTLFMLVLFQDLEDHKFDQPERLWEHALTTRIFHVDELPHFGTSRRRNIMMKVGVSAETLQDKVLRPMARYGFLESLGSGTFQFRAPVYRFVDLCMSVASAHDEEASPDGVRELLPSADQGVANQEDSP